MDFTSGIDENQNSLLYMNCFPNPSSGMTTIDYTLIEPSTVSISIANVSGRMSAQIINNQMQEPGNHTIDYDMSKFAPGMYYLTIQVGNNTETKKIVFVR